MPRTPQVKGLGLVRKSGKPEIGLRVLRVSGTPRKAAHPRVAGRPSAIPMAQGFPAQFLRRPGGLALSSGRCHRAGQRRHNAGFRWPARGQLWATSPAVPAPRREEGGTVVPAPRKEEGGGSTAEWLAQSRRGAAGGPGVSSGSATRRGRPRGPRFSHCGAYTLLPMP